MHRKASETQKEEPKSRVVLGNCLKFIILSLYPKLLKIPSLFIPPKTGKTFTMENNNINEKAFSIYHLSSLIYLMVSLLEKIKLCMTGSKGSNQIAFINLINSANKTDLKNRSIK